MIEENSEPPDNLYLKKSVPILSLLPKTLVNSNFLLKNGLSKHIDRLKLKVWSDLEQCFFLWERFSKKESLFDLWDFRYAWFEGYHYPLYFYTIYEGKNPLACLPLWYDTKNKRYEWFGSYWMEDNYFFSKEERLIDLLLMIIPKPIFLNAFIILPDKFLDNKDSFKIDEPKFVINIKGIKNIDQYLASLEKKHRYNLKRDYFSILNNYQPKIEIIEKPEFCHFENIIKLSKKRFNGTFKEESDVSKPERVAAFFYVLKNSGLYHIKFVKVFIQKYLAAVDLIITYKDRYYMLKGANDIERFPGIGNFLAYFELKDAIKNQFSLVDCLQGDYNWKHKYFERQKLHMYKK